MSNQGNQGYQKTSSAGTTALIVVLLLTTIAALVLATYAWAKYTSSTPGETTAVVAKWNVTGNSTDLTWSKTFTHVVAERLAPGTNGTIPVSLDVTGTEVDVAYTVTLVSAENKPTNLHFYTDSSKTTEITVGGQAYSGTIPVNGTNFSGAIYWDWPYETGDGANDIAANDAIDTQEGEAAATMTVQLRIDAVQVQPE